MAKKLNDRCPLQGECERKCAHKGRELDCDYYYNNAREGLVIEDQEVIREKQMREREEALFDELYSEDNPEDLGSEVQAEDHIPDAGNMVMLPISMLHPHPKNPRKELGDLTELADSIRAKGVFQNLTVVPGHYMSQDEWDAAYKKYEDNPSEQLRAYINRGWLPTEYTVIIGHRRRGASEIAGLTHLPCVIVNMTEKEQLETMLLENMQREDLTPYEQAQGFQMMIDMGDTPEQIAEKTGFSKKTVKRRLKMAELDPKALKEVSSRQISMDDFDQLAKIKDISKRNSVLKSIGTNNFASEVQTAINKQNIHEKLPVAKELVKRLNANKISQSATYGSEYTKVGSTIFLKNWDGETHPIPEGDARKLFYTLDANWGELAFYVKTPKAKPKKRPQEEIDREKRMAEANEEMTRLNELHYELRRNFVDSLKVGKNNQLAMLQAAVLACVGGSICYISSNRLDITRIIGMEDTYSERGKKVVEAFDKTEPKDYMKLIYHSLGDNKTRSFSTTYKGQFPQFRHCDELEIIYTMLTWLGYEMSDDEIALRNGTHELFSRK